MTLPRTVSEVVAEHVVFQVECIDRMYLNVYVPQLQYAAGLVGYVRRQLGLPIASTAPLARITDAFGAAMRRFAGDQQVPWVDFVKGQRKDDVMHEHLAPFQAAGHTEGVLFVGRAQEKTALFRTEKRRDAEGKTYPWIVKTTGLVNHFYVYAVDADFGPFFLKFCSYFPYNARLCLLTEPRAGSLHVTGQVPVRVATVPTRDRIRRAGTGPQRVGGASARSAAGRAGIRSSPSGWLTPRVRLSRRLPRTCGICRLGGGPRPRSGPMGWRCCAGFASWARSRCRGNRPLGSRPATSPGGCRSRPSRRGRTGVTRTSRRNPARRLRRRRRRRTR